MTSFKDLHRPGDPLLLPNAWDAVTGAALAAAGFPAIGTTSLGVAAAAGKRDATGDALEETIALAHRLARLDCHVTVDFEHGFSDDPDQVAELRGATRPSRRHQPRGPPRRPELHARKIAAVKAAARDLFVNARTDTHWLRDGDLARRDRPRHALRRRRRRRRLRPRPTARADIEAFVEPVHAPLNVLFTPGTPIARARRARRGPHQHRLAAVPRRAAAHRRTRAARSAAGDADARATRGTRPSTASRAAAS